MEKEEIKQEMETQKPEKETITIEGHLVEDAHYDKVSIPDEKYPDGVRNAIALSNTLVVNKKGQEKPEFYHIQAYDDNAKLLGGLSTKQFLRLNVQMQEKTKGDKVFQNFIVKDVKTYEKHKGLIVGQPELKTTKSGKEIAVAHFETEDGKKFNLYANGKKTSDLTQFKENDKVELEGYVSAKPYRDAENHKKFSHSISINKISPQKEMAKEAPKKAKVDIERD